MIKCNVSEINKTDSGVSGKCELLIEAESALQLELELEHIIKNILKRKPEILLDAIENVIGNEAEND